jgi:hypothetical protein
MAENYLLYLTKRNDSTLLTQQVKVSSFTATGIKEENAQKYVRDRRFLVILLVGSGIL